MKIALDLRLAGPEQGGIGRYQEKLLEHLIQLDYGNQYLVLVSAKPKTSLPENFQIKICHYRWYSLSEQIFLPIILWRWHPDLVHFAHFNVPIFYRGKFIVTIHDLIMTKFPSRKSSTLNYFLFAIKRWAYHLTISSAVSRAKNIIAVSKFTAQDIINYFHLNEQQSQKIKIIYEGLSDLGKGQNVRTIDLPTKYFLYVGNAYPHKNLEFLIKTFKEFLLAYPNYYLLIVGSRSHFYNRLEQWAKSYLGNSSQQVLFPGFVADQDLICYYQQAQAYIFPSLYEGFGLPPLEAFSHRIPVLSSNSSCLPEILGSAALYFDPKSQADLLNKMEIIISNPDLKNKLVIGGLEQIKKYSWAKAATETLRLYQQ